MTTQPSVPRAALSAATEKPPPLPPRWFIRSFWVVHRATYSATRGRIGLRNATPERWGMLRLATLGRRTGKERRAILGYLNDGPNLVLLATNGMGEAAPAWWLNLQAHAEARVDLADGSRAVRARVPDEDERPRLWDMWVSQGEDLDAHAAARSLAIPVVVLEPLSDDEIQGARSTGSHG